MELLHSNNRPQFETERLVVNPVVVEHAQVMVDVLSDPTIYKYIDESPPSLSELKKRYEFLSKGKSPDGQEHWLTWVVFKKKTPKVPIGYIQATIKEPELCTLGYVFNSQYWGKGYASECLTALLNLIKKLYLVEEIQAEMDEYNTRSKQLITKLGFSLKEVIKNGSSIRGIVNDELIFQMDCD